MFSARAQIHVFRGAINRRKHLFFFARRKGVISHTANSIQMDILSGIKKCERREVSTADIGMSEHKV